LTALDVLRQLVYLLALVGLVISRRFGDRLQYRLLLALGCFALGVSVASLVTEPSALDWLGVLLGASAASLALVFLLRLRS
jgi:uncharacterized membrane protein YqgA involved in biofilm formation